MSEENQSTPSPGAETGEVAPMPRFTAMNPDKNGSSASFMSPSSPSSATLADLPSLQRPLPGASQAVSSPSKRDSDLSDVKQVKMALSLSTTLMELRGRVLQTYYSQAPKDLLSADADEDEQLENAAPADDLSHNIADDFWRASTWRGLFSRAVSLYQDLLDEDLNVTRFGLSPDKPLYLADQTGIPYFNIGLPSPNERYSLLEKLRRSINFLLCLYQQLDDCDSIIEKVFTSDPPYLNFPAPLPTEATQLRQARYQLLLKDLTAQINILIIAWDSYVREQLFARSSTMLMGRYGYAAGRSLGELNWSLAIRTAQAKLNYPAIEQARKQGIYEVWLDLFSPERVSFLQHQLNAIVGVLQEDYESKLSASPSNPTANNDDDDDNSSDLKSPRTAIRSVIQSIEYWELTVLEMSSQGRLQHLNDPSKPPPDAPRPAWSKDLKLAIYWSEQDLDQFQEALTVQSGNWFALVAGRQDLSSFKVANIASDLVQNYRKEITGLVKNNLLDSFTQMQKEITNLIKTASTAATEVVEEARDVLGSFFNVKWLWVWIGLVVLILVVFGAGVLLVVISGNPAGSGLSIAGVLQALGLGWGIQKLKNGQGQVEAVADKNKENISEAKISAAISTNQGFGAMVLSGVGQVGKELEGALDRGFSQLKRELAVISATVALTAPLAEYVVYHCSLEDDWDFLNQIIWNDSIKKSQLTRIITAAFGSTGAFLLSETETGPATTPQ